MARALRTELVRRGVALTHGECLDIVARQFGLDNWNILAARIDGRDSHPAGPVQDRRLLPLPLGWRFDGGRLDYDAGVDLDQPCGTGHAALIRSRFTFDPAAPVSLRDELAGLVQEVDAIPYRGMRLSVQARLRTEDVIGAASLWVQIDTGSPRCSASEQGSLDDQIGVGALTGTAGWLTQLAVLDVPADAEFILYGFYLRGSGAVWTGDFKLGVAPVGEGLAQSGRALPLPAPVNLDFSACASPSA